MQLSKSSGRAIAHGAILLSLSMAVAAGASSVAPEPAAGGISRASLAQLAMPFIANQGQLDPQVAYYAPTFAGTVYVTKKGQIVYSLPAKHAAQTTPDTKHGRHSPQGWTLTENLLTSAHLTPKAEGGTAVQVNYFIGDDRAAWRRGLPTSERVSLGEAWPGIKVSLEAHGGSVETFYTLAPYAKTDRIHLAIAGAKQLHLQQGRLVADTDLGPLTFLAPRAWQEIHGTREPVSAYYTLRGHEYGFAIGPHDPHTAVVIDPDLQATFLGGSDGNWVVPMALALDAGGDVYVTGYTVTRTFPGTTGGAQAAIDGVRNDAFIAKLNPTLTTLEQATYLGGSSDDYPYALAISASGDVYVSGETTSTDFPGTVGGAQPALDGTGYNGFIAKLSADLTTLEQATYLGGGGSNVLAVATDAAGDVYAAGDTGSTGFPGTAGGAQAAAKGGGDGFIAKLNAGLTSIEQATYLGGSGLEFTECLALDASGDVYVTGYTYSKDFPGTLGGAQAAIDGTTYGDVFIAKLNAGLTTLDQASYLGGNSEDYARAIAIGPSGDVYIAGDTYSTDFPGTSGGAQAASAGGSEVFVAKLDAGLTTLEQATYLGTSTNEWAYSAAIDLSGDVYVAGTTVSTNFPGTAGGAQATYGGGSSDIFVAKLNAALTELTQATYFGGTGMDEVGTGKKLAINTAGEVYVAGDTNSQSLPGTTGSFQTSNTEGTVPTGVTAKFPADLKSHVDVSLNLSLGAPTSVSLSSLFNYSLNVTDNSSDDTNATSVVLTDTLPGEVGLISATPSQGTCSTSGATVTCHLGNLAAGGSATVSIAVTGVSPGNAADAAAISADQALASASISTASANTLIDSAPTANHVDVATLSGFTITGALSATPAYTGQSLKFSLLTVPAHGKAVITDSGSGAFTYTSAVDYEGSDSFTYEVTDSFGLSSNAGSVSITVADNAPTAQDGSATTRAGQTYDGWLIAAHYTFQPITYSIVSPPSHGSATIIDAGSGAFSYVPGSGFAGNDSFTFQVKDAVGKTSNVATVSLSVTDVAATANDGIVHTTEGQAVSGTLFIAIAYPGQELSYVLVTQPTHGSVTLTNPLTGSFTYTPAAGFAGTDSFQFEAVDAYGTVSNIALETALVDAGIPIANDGSLSVKFVGIVRGQLSATPAYAGEVLTFQIVSPPAHGSLQSFDPATGAFEYKPNGHFLGTDSFTFDVKDSRGAVSDVATESVTLVSEHTILVKKSPRVHQ